VWFSSVFEGTIWNIVSSSENTSMFIEIRDEQRKQVHFSGIDLSSRKLIVDHLTFEEPWWISLADVSEGLLLLKVYTDINNPDKKAILAYDLNKRSIGWWKNNFSMSFVSEGRVFGSETGLGMKFLVLDLLSGEPSSNQAVPPPKQNFQVIKPLQYHQETSHFDTMKSFLQKKYQMVPESVIEYLEYAHHIIVSFYAREVSLVNFLIVMDESGEELLIEKIGEELKGIGSDTFFILEGFLIFVKNRSALVSYKLV
jgi:hypothetical protein